MSPLIRKEVRLLLPHSVLIVCLLSLIMAVPRHFNQGVDFGLVGVPLLMVCPILATLMVVGSLGRELSPEMIGRFLSQPIARARVWWVKTSLLSLFLAPLWWGWWQVFRYHFSVNTTASELNEIRLRSLLITFALLAGGLWSIVLVRSIVTAFWVTILAPSGLAMLVEVYLEGRVAHAEWFLVALLAVYSVAGLAVAFRLFLQLQDMDPPTQLLTMTDTGRAWLKLPNTPGQRRGRSSRTTLFAKEVRLHQGLVGFAAGIAVLHLGILALKSYTAGLHRSPTLEMLCTHFWVVWLILPVLIGCQLFAEERRAGVWESQLTLPCPRSRQLVIKGVVAVALALLLGAFLPIVLEQNQILTESRFDPAFLLNARSHLSREGVLSKVLLFLAESFQAMPFHPEPLAKLSLAALGLVLVSAFASSLTRTFVQALTAALAGVILVLAVALSVSFQAVFIQRLAFGGVLGFLLLIPALAATLLWLTARNACQVEIGVKSWAQSAFRLILVLLTGTATASLIYHRAWEKLTAAEPPHGVPTFKMEDQLRIQSSWRALSLTSSDGRAWSANHRGYEMTQWEFFFGRQWLGKLIEPRFQFKGSDWTEVVHCAWDTIGIQKDGSLWVSEEPPPGGRPAGDPLQDPGRIIQMVRFGKSQAWKQAVRFRAGALLLDTNGTLWVWEKAKWSGLRQYRGLGEEVPFPLSSEHDWTDLHESPGSRGYGFELLKQDGSAWLHPAQDVPLTDRKQLDDRTELSRAVYLDAGRARRRAIADSQSDPTEPFQVGINREGKLEVVAAWQSSHDARRWSFKPTSIPFKENNEIPWIDVTSGADRRPLVSLRADGTLWTWRFPTSPLHSPQAAQSSQLGTHSDWVALAPFEGDVISLAADGSLWAWQFESPFEEGYRLLAPSSKPQLLGNILAK